MKPPATPAATANAKPKAKAKTVPGAQVADIKAEARKMLKKGLISQKQHDGLAAKADKVSQALGTGGEMEMPAE